MTLQDLIDGVCLLDEAPSQSAGVKRLHKEVRLIDLKAKLAKQPTVYLNRRLASLSHAAEAALRADIEAATGQIDTSQGDVDTAFERAVSTMESLVTHPN